MNFDNLEIRRGIKIGLLSGAIGGVVALLVNALTGVFPLESTLMHNLAAFMIGGALFGVIAGGFMAILGNVLPVGNLIVKAALVSAVLWLVVRAGGVVLTLINHHRFHIDASQSIQGFCIAIIMGLIMGLLWKKNQKEAA